MDISRMWEYMGWQMTWLLQRITGRLADLQSIYQPLQHNEIRLITLAPGKWRDPIECNLQTVSLDDNPTYEALSYVWGDASLRRWVYLKKSNFDVSKSLEVALRHLRHEDSERVMWIDAICINQSDDAEKSEQVKKMQLIYARTSHLVVWVGEASEDSDLGMRTLEQIGEELKEFPLYEVDLANVSLIRNLPESIDYFDPKPWIALNRLFQRPWFQRVWVLYSSICNLNRYPFADPHNRLSRRYVCLIKKCLSSVEGIASHGSLLRKPLMLSKAINGIYSGRGSLIMQVMPITTLIIR